MALDPEFLPEDPDQFEKRLQTFLYRWDCPPPEQLSDYHLNLVDAQKRAAIEQHLQNCVLCRKELSALDQFLANEDPVSEIPAPETGKFPLLKSLPILSHLTTYPAAARGEEAEPAKFVFEGDITVYLQVETEIDHYVLLGQLAVSPERWQIWAGALVEVWHDNTLATTTSVDTDSTFRCKLTTLKPSIVRITARNGSVLVCHN